MCIDMYHFSGQAYDWVSVLQTHFLVLVYFRFVLLCNVSALFLRQKVILVTYYLFASIFITINTNTLGSLKNQLQLTLAFRLISGFIV